MTERCRIIAFGNHPGVEKFPEIILGNRKTFFFKTVYRFPQSFISRFNPTYGLANAVTRAAQDVESYDRSTDMESIGYKVLGMSATAWKRLNAASKRVA